MIFDGERLEQYHWDVILCWVSVCLPQVDKAGSAAVKPLGTTMQLSNSKEQQKAKKKKK